MKRIIAIANQKGGVGKTTTTVNLSACLAEAGKRVLVIDMDPQGNTTSGFGLDKEGTENTVYDVLIGECDLKDAIRTTAVKKLDIVTSNIDLTGAEIELLNVEEKEYILRKEAKTIESKYDYVVIDCPPSLNMLTVNALTTADTVLIPIQCEYYALEGLSQLMYTIDLVKNRLNEDLMVEGVVFTMYDSRTNLSAQVVENVRDNLEYNIYNTIIPRNVRLAEAPSYGMPITVYDPKSAGAESYRKLAKEVIKNKSMDRS
ncbi:MAG: ParA family protein [Lachnospiraceae bacterium]|nr:ParA family protein [Lachnospiraceae bacterium]